MKLIVKLLILNRKEKDNAFEELIECLPSSKLSARKIESFTGFLNPVMEKLSQPAKHTIQNKAAKKVSTQ